MLLDDFLPIYDVSDTVATLVHADAATTWAALIDVDLIELGRNRPVVGALGALRELPDVISHLIRGEALPPSPRQLRLRELPQLATERGGWIVLGDRPEDEIALGVAGKFWRPVIELAPVTRETFRAFAAPGFAKTIYSLSIRSIGEHRTQLVGAMRTATTDESARRAFRRYWTLGVGSGAHVLVNALLDAARESAERHALVAAG